MLSKLEKIAQIGSRSRVRLGLVASRLARAYGVDRDLAVLALLGQHPEARQCEYDLPPVHYARKSRLLDQLGCSLLLDWTGVDYPEVRDLPADAISGHIAGDILLACRAYRDQAAEHVCRTPGNYHAILQLLLLEADGHVWTWLAPWYASEVRKRLDTEVAFFASLR